VTLCRGHRRDGSSRPSIGTTTRTQRRSSARRTCCGANGRVSVASTSSGLPRRAPCVPIAERSWNFWVSRSSSPPTLPDRCARSRTCADTGVHRSCRSSRAGRPSHVTRNRCAAHTIPGPTGWTACCCTPPIPRTSISTPRPSDCSRCAPMPGADSSGSPRIWRRLRSSTRCLRCRTVSGGIHWTPSSWACD